MTAATIQALATIGAATIAAIAAVMASKAEKNSRPVSNGFAKHVLDTLSRIESRIDKHVDNHK